VPFAKLEPLLREAVALLREGFAVPAPGGANTPPSALMLSHLQHTHKDFYEFMAKGEKVNWEECVKGEGALRARGDGRRERGVMGVASSGQQAFSPQHFPALAAGRTRAPTSPTRCRCTRSM